MNDDGYTLAEMLAALAILGMAIGGLGLVASLIARQQLSAHKVSARLVEERTVDRALNAWLAEQDVETLDGDAHRLSASCGSTTCTARLEANKNRTVLILQARSGAVRRLRLGGRNARFGYLDARGGAVARWAPSVASGERNTGDGLRAVVLTANGDAPMAVARVLAREARDCQFDAIARACRIKTP